MVEPLRILEPDGTLRGDPRLDDDEIVRLYREMVTARVYDRKATAMQKQGRLATYAPFEGQEAAQLGAAAALRVDDWLVATYRDPAAMWLQGYPMSLLVLNRIGDERGGHPPEGVHVLPPSITVGGHMIHAVGLAWAERLQGRDRVALTLFGDGATSEGDFHEAMNFAGVYRTATIFVCQNNGWAISLPRERQTASATIAQKAEAYGMPGVLVDGNDLLAVHAAVRDAVDRARAGEGPTLVEALTYRLGPHTTADDPSRYRDAAETEAWRGRDPLARVRRHLEAKGLWDDDRQAEAEAAAASIVETAVAEAESVPPPTVEDVFAGMFAALPAHLARQLDEARRRWPS